MAMQAVVPGAMMGAVERTEVAVKATEEPKVAAMAVEATATAKVVGAMVAMVAVVM